MADRYFVETPITGNRATLVGPEAHHLLHVMRADEGTTVTLFDGSGAEFSAVVERLGRSEVQLVIHARESIDRELPFELTLAVALPKGDRQKWLVEKAVELGVTRIVLLKTQRGVAQPVDQALARLRRSVVEASKQCGRNRLLQIEEPRSWRELIEHCDSAQRFVAHPKTADDAGSNVARTSPAMHELRSEDRAKGVCVAIGPEGGFTDEEVAAACKAGWQTVDLGRRILRVETAAVFLVAMLVAGAE